MNPEQLRPMLFIALAFVMFLMWQEWQRDYGPKPPPAPPAQETTATTPAGAPSDQPIVPTPSQSNEVPVTPTVESSSPASATNTPEAPTSVEPAASIVTVETDVIRVNIDTAGGTLRALELINYPDDTEEASGPFRLLNDSLPDLFMAQSGLLGENAPNHTAIMQSAKSSYVLGDGSDTIEVPLTWRAPSGVEVTKVFVFTRGAYEFDVRYDVDNRSDADWTARMYV